MDASRETASMPVRPRPGRPPAVRPQDVPRVRLAPGDEAALVRRAVERQGSPGPSPVAVVVDGPSGDAVLLVLAAVRAEGGWFADVNCLTDRLWVEQGLLSSVQTSSGVVAAAALALPAGWRGGVRLLPVPQGMGDDAASWGRARRAGIAPRAPGSPVWPGSPFAPTAEIATAGAPEPRWAPSGPATDSPPIERRALRIPEADVELLVVRDPAGRGTVLLLDGETFLHFRAADALAALPVPPATVVALGAAGRPDRASVLVPDGAVRDAVLAGVEAVRDDDGPVVVAGASLGGAAALHWGLTRPDLVTGVVALSGSYWMRDPRGAPVWQAALDHRPGDGPLPAVHLGWGRCEVKLAAVNAEAHAALAGTPIRLTSGTWVGGHDFVHWRDEVAEGYRLVTGGEPLSGAAP